MPDKKGPGAISEVSFFPGCSLAGSSREAYDSMRQVCGKLGLQIIELEDWNCCGSSSAHSLNKGLGLALAGRNLALAPKGRPLMAACPSCHKNLRGAQIHLSGDPKARERIEESQGAELDPGLQIVSFLEILDYLQKLPAWKNLDNPDSGLRLGGLKIAAYYGCMLAAPRQLQNQQRYSGIMERSMAALGGQSVNWSCYNRCCGTFLSAARPQVAGKVINHIMQDAVSHGAECIVTACAMCQMNLELRCELQSPLPVLHFAEVLALALESADSEKWFKRHLIDPRPLLEGHGLV